MADDGPAWASGLWLDDLIKMERTRIIEPIGHCLLGSLVRRR